MKKAKNEYVLEVENGNRNTAALLIVERVVAKKFAKPASEKRWMAESQSTFNQSDDNAREGGE